MGLFTQKIVCIWWNRYGVGDVSSWQVLIYDIIMMGEIAVFSGRRRCRRYCCFPCLLMMFWWMCSPRCFAMRFACWCCWSCSAASWHLDMQVVTDCFPVGCFEWLRFHLHKLGAWPVRLGFSCSQRVRLLLRRFLLYPFWCPSSCLSMSSWGCFA